MSVKIFQQINVQKINNRITFSVRNAKCIPLNVIYNDRIILPSSIVCISSDSRVSRDPASFVPRVESRESINATEIRRIQILR
jgi:hypothetical protein